MSRARRLATLVKLASLIERNSRRSLGVAVGGLQQAQQQQRQLEDYLGEYGRAWLEQGAAGIDARNLRAAAGFREQLTRTITVQQQSVAQRDAAVRQAAGAWQDTRRRERSLERLLELAREAERRDRHRREQHEIDDLLAPRHALRKPFS